MLRKLSDKFQENLSRPGIIDARARPLRNTAIKGPLKEAAQAVSQIIICVVPYPTVHTIA
jgi:hypothetical protein